MYFVNYFFEAVSSRSASFKFISCPDLVALQMIKIWQLAVGSNLAVSNLAVVYGIPYAKVLLYVYSNDTLIVRGFGGFFLEVS